MWTIGWKKKCWHFVSRTITIVFLCAIQCDHRKSMCMCRVRICGQTLSKNVWFYALFNITGLWTYFQITILGWADNYTNLNCIFACFLLLAVHYHLMWQIATGHSANCSKHEHTVRRIFLRIWLNAKVP